MSYEELEQKYLLPTYDKLPITLVRGEGCYVYDDKGTKYLDFYGGHAVAATGHCHKDVTKAIADQAGKLIFYSNVCYNDARAEAAEMVVKNAYAGSRSVFFCNSGTEANECALKIARRATGRPRIVATTTGFHGRTIGSLSVTGGQKYREPFPENLANLTEFVPFGEFEAVERALSPDVAAVIIEPVQSTGGVRVGNKRYYERLREMCSGNGCALIFDEVQTAFGRTGKMMAGQHWGVEPDICTTAKAAAGGVPIGIVILNEAIAGAPAPGEHASTFGGGPLAMAALKANLNVIIKEKLVDNAREMEMTIRDSLGANPLIRAIKGKGLLLGLDMTKDAKTVIAELLKRKIIVGSSGPADQIRLLPPLTIQPEHVKELRQALREIAAIK